MNRSKMETMLVLALLIIAGTVCGDDGCCYEKAALFIEVRKSNDSNETSPVITFGKRHHSIIESTAEVCFKCIGLNLLENCTGHEDFAVRISDGRAIPKVPVCGKGFWKAEYLVKFFGRRYGCSFQNDDNRTYIDMNIYVHLHQSKCQLPTHLPGAWMRKYYRTENNSVAVNYTCFLGKTELMITCQGNTWTNASCPDPVMCEDVWPNKICSRNKDACDIILEIMEYCMETCNRLSATCGTYVTGGRIEPTDLKTTEEKATAEAKRTAAHRITPSPALLIILPLITCAWM